MTRRDRPPFAARTCVERGTAVMELSGELDIASAAIVRDELLRLIQADELPDLVVAASGLTFVDSSGIAVLMMAARRWEEAGRRVVLREPSPQLVRIMELTGVMRAFDVEGG